MASDLSNLIQNGLKDTLESLLAKEAVLKETTKAHPKDLEGQAIQVEVTFEFESITSTWSFLIPARSASFIFNVMMGEDTEPSNSVDDDILDATSEVVSNISGALTTNINGSGFNDLGNVKFAIASSKIIESKDYELTDRLFRNVILLDEKEVVIFIDFDESILSHIDSILASPVTQRDDDEDTPIEEETSSSDDTKEDTPSDDNSIDTDDKEENSQTSKEETKSSDDKIDEEDDENIEEKKSKLAFLKKLNFLKVDEDLSPEEKKQLKLKKIIILVAGLLVLTILILVGLFFSGAFDPEPIKKPITQEEKVDKTDVVPIKAFRKQKKITFNISQINVKRLNKKLSLLTKYEILEDDEIEQAKLKEKERLYKEQQAKLEKFAQKNKEEPLPNFDLNNTDKKLAKDKQEAVKQAFVQIPPLKIGKYKSFIKRSKAIKANLSICKDTNGRTQVFIGPFISKYDRKALIATLNKIQQKNIKLLNLSKKEFQKQCNF